MFPFFNPARQLDVLLSSTCCHLVVASSVFASFLMFPALTEDNRMCWLLKRIDGARRREVLIVVTCFYVQMNKSQPVLSTLIKSRKMILSNLIFLLGLCCVSQVFLLSTPHKWKDSTIIVPINESCKTQSQLLMLTCLIYSRVKIQMLMFQYWRS